MTAYLQQLFQFNKYKGKQGRVARQATFFALVVLVASGSWALKSSLEVGGGDATAKSAGAIALGVFAAGCWAAYRLIQLPKFAEFLIAVEQEMNKVSWPSRGELWKASMVVIVTIFLLAMFLFVYDILWREIIGTILGDETMISTNLRKLLGGAPAE